MSNVNVMSYAPPQRVAVLSRFCLKMAIDFDLNICVSNLKTGVDLTGCYNSSEQCLEDSCILCFVARRPDECSSVSTIVSRLTTLECIMQINELSLSSIRFVPL